MKSNYSITKSLVLLAAVLIFSYSGLNLHAAKVSYHSTIVIPTARHDHYEPVQGLLTIKINAEGRVLVEQEYIDDIGTLDEVLAQKIIEGNYDTCKILLKADKQTEFGKVVEVLDKARQAGLDTVGLVTVEYAGLAHFLKPVKKK